MENEIAAAAAGSADALGIVGTMIAGFLATILAVVAKSAIKYINSKQDLVQLEYDETWEGAVRRTSHFAANHAEELVENAMGPHLALLNSGTAVAEEVEEKLSKALSEIPVPVDIERAGRSVLPTDATEKAIKKMGVAATEVVDKLGLDPIKAVRSIGSILSGSGLGMSGKKR